MQHFFTRLSIYLILLIGSIVPLAGQVTLSGNIKDFNNVPLVNASVILEGDVQATTTTNEDGYYAFEVPAGGDFKIVPVYTGAITTYLNGVTTFDAVLLSRHITGEEALNAPYGLIAADVDRSGVVDSTDIDMIRLLITQEIQAFSNNTAWRFIPVDFEFPNPQNPFAVNFPEEIQVENASASLQNLDFVGVKIGDLNGSAATILPNVVPTSIVRGKVYADLSENCTLDEAERGFANWIVKANGVASTYQTTSADGSFILNLPLGDYVLSVEPTNDYWESCANAIPISIQSFTQIRQDFAMHPNAECPFLEVNISAPFLRRCFDNTYYVQYCNSGTLDAENAYVEVELDSFLAFQSSSITATALGNNIYRFDVGSVKTVDCQTFTFVATVSCDAELGQTHCVEATIFPNISCAPANPAWDGASLEVEGACVNDSVQFRIKNVGTNMTAPTRSIVIEDDLVMLQRPIQLNAGATEIFSQEANGATYYLQVNQPKGHPFSTFASVAVEGCGMGSGGQVSYGFVNQYPQADEAPFKSIDCQDNRGSFDPNDKQASPAGITENHYIEANTELEYKIRFQNTGTDTAFTVVIRDTLSDQLNPSSIQPGASSHPYTYLLENNILTFLFSNIALPDSNVNEPASHGFVQFKIQQQPDLEDETLIENSAGIYFDFNEPVITNTAWHQIGRAYYNIISQVENLLPNLQVTVAPNPFSDFARIQLQTEEQMEGSFRLYDAYGKLVSTQVIRSNYLDFSANGLSPGFYSFEIIVKHQRVSVGKLLIQR